MLFILSVFLDFVCFANDDFMHWMLLTLTLINETVFDDSIMMGGVYIGQVTQWLL